MINPQLKQQVETLREAFGYITRFKNETFVIQLESSLLNHPGFPILIKDIVLLHQMGIKIVLVPGAKVRIDEVLAAYKIATKTVDGIRISTADAIPFIKMAAFDVSNKIMTMLAASNTNAIVGNWVKARGIGIRRGIDFQNSGIVDKINTDIVARSLSDGIIPIFPNIGWNAQGTPYNISSNELALALSIALKASKLFFITDSGGISAKDYTISKEIYINSDNYIGYMTVAQAETLIKSSKRNKRNNPNELIELACNACRNKVDRVHIVDGRIDGMILKEIFSNRGLGTMIYANSHDNIRPMVQVDIPEVLRIMQPLVDAEALLPRSAENLEEHISDYAVYEVDGIIHGCCALYKYPGRIGEIGGIVVDELYANMGIGKRLVHYFIDRSYELKLKTLIVLTTQTADWFSEIGFTKGTVAMLPATRLQQYNKKRSSLVLYKNLGKRNGRRFDVD